MLSIRLAFVFSFFRAVPPTIQECLQIIIRSSSARLCCHLLPAKTESGYWEGILKLNIETRKLRLKTKLNTKIENEIENENRKRKNRELVGRAVNQSLQYLPTEDDEVEDLFLLLKEVKVSIESVRAPRAKRKLDQN